LNSCVKFEIIFFIKNNKHYGYLFILISMNFTEKEIISVGQIQNNSVINADCLNVMKYIEDESIDMILCDLPYG